MDPALAQPCSLLAANVVGDSRQTLYDRNRKVYRLLRYGAIETSKKLLPKWEKAGGEFAAEPNTLDRHLQWMRLMPFRP